MIRGASILSALAVCTLAGCGASAETGLSDIEVPEVCPVALAGCDGEPWPATNATTSPPATTAASARPRPEPELPTTDDGHPVDGEDPDAGGAWR